MTTFAGTFITAPAPAPAPAPYFRREFTAMGRVTSARLFVAALGVVAPYVNGTRVGEDVLLPGWTSYAHRVNVRSYDVAPLITGERNAIGAIVGEGWAAGRLGWEGLHAIYTDRPALFLQLEFEDDRGSHVICSDENFRVSFGAVVKHSLYDGEEYDARREPIGWSAAGFDDANWSPAEPLAWDLGTLVTPLDPPIRRTEELAPVAISRVAKERFLVDFGQNITGWVRLTVSGTAGQTITLRHAEHCSPDGALDRESNRSALATDRYTMTGALSETWEPEFTFHGFRYVEIEGWPGEPKPEDLRAIVVHSDMVRTGWFRSSDELLNRFHDNVVWSMRGNFVGIPTDCPQRDERLGWTGDINAFAPTATFLYDVRGVLASWLADLALEQREFGKVPWTVPHALPNPPEVVALWSDVAVNLPWALYQEYGDVRHLTDAYESMTAYVRQVAGLLDENDLWSSGFQFGDWLDPATPASNPMAGRTDRYLVANAYFSRSVRQLAQIARILDRPGDADEFAELAERVVAAFRREFITPSGRMVDDTETAYSLAICFDLLEPAQRDYAGSRLAALVTANGYRIATGFAGTPHVTDALSQCGYLEVAYRLLMETDCPSFLYPVRMGATTIWERWDSVLPDGTLNSTGMTSLNHYALGAMSDWIHRTVGGLERIAPGYERVRIAPRPGGNLTQADITHDTRHGRISVSWAIADSRFSLRVSIPEGITAIVSLPGSSSDEGFTVGAGTHEWVREVAPDFGRFGAPSLHSSLKEIFRDGRAWDAVSEAMTRHLPAFATDETSPFWRMPLVELLTSLPGLPSALAEDLGKALGSPSEATVAAA